MSSSDEIKALLSQVDQLPDLLASTKENLRAWLGSGMLDAIAVGSLAALIKEGASDELNDRFFTTIAFGTGGMRGRTQSSRPAPGEMDEAGKPLQAAVGSAFLNDYNVIRATLGLYRYTANFLKAQGRYDAPKLVIAHDVRYFSRHFCELAASVWNRCGGRAMIFSGPRSTPQLSYSVRYLKAHAGVVITASHNPPHDNGYKVYFEDGGQVVPPHDKGIIEEVGAVDLGVVGAFRQEDLSSVAILGPEVDRAYQNFLLESIGDSESIREHQPKVVFTPIHGTGAEATLPVLKQLGAELFTVEEQMLQDAAFPTVKSPNPENAEALSMAMALAGEVDADLVLATDPDADRMGAAVRSPGGGLTLITGNQIGSVMAEYRIAMAKKQGLIPPGGSEKVALIKTFVTTPLQDAIAQHHGLKCINTLTGFKWIGRKIGAYQKLLEDRYREDKGIGLDYDKTSLETRADLLQEYSTFYLFGGEESYGYLASDLVRDKDANAASLLFIEVAAWLKGQGLTFPEFLEQIYRKYGFYTESAAQLVYEGASGAAKIKGLLKSYRDNPPREVGSLKVNKVQDFGRDTILDADGEKIPEQDFFFLDLEDGYRVAIRGSGTEPKIKFYLFAQADFNASTSLAEVQEQRKLGLKQLGEDVVADARKRVGE